MVAVRQTLRSPSAVLKVLGSPSVACLSVYRHEALERPAEMRSCRNTKKTSLPLSRHRKLSECYLDAVTVGQSRTCLTASIP